MKRTRTMLVLGLSLSLSLVGCMSATAKEQMAAETDGSPIDRVTAEGVTTYAHDSAEGQALLASFQEASEQSAAAEGDVGVVAAPLFTLEEGISCSSRDGSIDCYCPSGCCRTQTLCTCC